MHKMITGTSNTTYVRVILIGIALFVATRYVDPGDLFYFHRLSQSLAMSACVILISRSWRSPLTRLFALIGRTSFSAYAFHLVVGALLFFVFGYFQKLSMSMLFFLAIATYLIAALLCLLMQRRFQSGVLELLMKRLAYGRG
jgi:uncharacterized membrane protein YeiB